MSAMFEFRRLYCAHAKLHAPFPFDGLLIYPKGENSMAMSGFCCKVSQ